MKIPKLSNLKAVLFDLDGTLLDSFPAHYQTFEAVLNHFGIKISETLFLETYSPNWYHTYELLGLPRDLWPEADALWLEEAARHQPTLFAGVYEMLAQLKTQFPLGLVTSGTKSRVMRDMARCELAEFFTVIVTGDDIKLPKPDPDGLLLALQTLKVNPNQSVYIGDAAADYEMARAAGAAFIGVHSRFGGLNSNAGCQMVPTAADLKTYF
jgi:HAD superfamily hydrolase (TIGR01509 family)